MKLRYYESRVDDSPRYDGDFDVKQLEDFVFESLRYEVWFSPPSGKIETHIGKDLIRKLEVESPKELVITLLGR